MWTVYQLRVEGAELPFYVGCTSRDNYRRLVEHNRSRTENFAKKAIMDAAREVGKEVLVETLSTFDDGDEAFTEEKRQIALIGRLPIGPLTNKSDGGRENAGVQWTAESRKKAADAKRGHSWNKGRPRPDFREKTRKDVTAFREDGSVFGSYETARLAEEATGVFFKKISEVARGKIGATKSSNGEVFQFKFGIITDSIEPASYRKRNSGSK